MHMNTESHTHTHTHTESTHVDGMGGNSYSPLMRQTVESARRPRPPPVPPPQHTLSHPPPHTHTHTHTHTVLTLAGGGRQLVLPGDETDGRSRPANHVETPHARVGDL